MIRFFAAALMCMCVSLPSWGETRTYDGIIMFSDDVARIDFTLANPLQNVAVWSDSWGSAGSFDPIVFLWRDGALVGYNDDGCCLMPAQGTLDSGMFFNQLASGNYILTVTQFANFSVSNVLADGFVYDDPSYQNYPIFDCPSATNCPGGYYRVHLQDGFTGPPPAVPEPQSWLMLLGGVLLMFTFGRYNDGHVPKLIRQVRHVCHYRIPQQHRPA